MEYRILGPLEVWDDERVVTLRRKKHRSLLALLLLRAGELVSVDVLIEELWGAKPPRTAREALHNYVSQLRRELGDDVIETHGQGYLLHIEPAQLDLIRFERLVADAQETDSAEKRASQLGQALALWRGPPLGDLAYEPFAGAEIQRLEELHLAARQDLIDAQLELGRNTDVVGKLEALVEEHPFDERSRAQLMLARYRSGRQADALEAYQDARRALVDNLGLEPGVALRELQQAMLRQDPSLELPSVLPSVEERRMTVTVLSCEVVPAASGVDPEALRRSTARALSTVRAAIDAHGGTVETRTGDELLGVFGLPVAHEDDALRAVRAAAELREELANVELHIGIDTGEVLAGHGFVSGEVVGRGKRLARSAVGEILLGKATLERCRSAVKVEPANDAFRLLEVEQGVRAIGRALDTPLVGRNRELTALRQAYEQARNESRGRMVAVVGEPGIGKSRLAGELATVVGEEATVLVGRCVSYGEGATYLPLREMIAQAGGSLEETIGGAGSVGEQLLAVQRFFERRAAEGPLLLAFDDVHWAEPTLLDFVEQLGARAEGPILTLCLARPELRERRPALAEAALELGPLGEKQVQALVDSLAEELPDPVRMRVVEAAGGNPLFAEQLVAFAEEGGAVDAMPPSTEALIAARLDLLEPEERAVLQRAAVIGRLFSRGAVEDLSPANELAAVGDCLLGLADKRLLRRRPDGFRFHHVLVRDVAYASLPKAERSELHERLADWLDERGESDELVGYHLEQAHYQRSQLGLLDGRTRRLAGDAGARLGAAGIEAWKRGDTPAAVNLLGRASALLPERNPLRLELCCELGLALRTAGDLAQAEETLVLALEIAAAAGDRRLELRAQLELAYVRLFSDPEGRADELLDVAARALPLFEAVDDHRSLGRAWLTLSFVHGLMYCRHGKGAEAAERALDHHRECGWPTSACLAFLAAAAQSGPMPAKEAIRLCRQLIARADLGGEANVLPPLAELEAMRGRFGEARRLVAKARAAYDQLGQRALAETNCGPVEGRIELLAGDAPAAERALRASYVVLEHMGGLSYLATGAAELGDALFRLDQYDEAERLSRRAEDLGATDDVLTQILWRSLRARLLARAGSFVEAETLISEATRLAEETDALNRRAKVLLDRAEVLRLGGKADEAVDVVEQAIELFEQKENAVAARRAQAVLLELTPP